MLQFSDNLGVDDVDPGLTARERQVCRLISLGCSVKQTAAILGRSASTVDKHKTHAMRKLNVNNVASLTRSALALGLTTLTDRLTVEETSRLNRKQFRPAETTAICEV